MGRQQQAQSGIDKSDARVQMSNEQDNYNSRHRTREEHQPPRPERRESMHQPLNTTRALTQRETDTQAFNRAVSSFCL